MAAHMHDGRAPRDLEQKDSGGNSDKSQRFMEKLQIRPTFDITCAACCWSYLVNQRKYEDGGEDDIHEGVKFGKCMGTKCYIDGPRGPRVNCVVKTDYDNSLGKRKPCAVRDSHTYQFYVKRDAKDSVALGASILMNVRIEAIAVGKIQSKKDLQNCYFSYCDAALHELYREKEGKVSLQGECVYSYSLSQDFYNVPDLPVHDDYVKDEDEDRNPFLDEFFEEMEYTYCEQK